MQKIVLPYIRLILFSVTIPLILAACSKSDSRVESPAPPPALPQDTTPTVIKKWIVSTFAGSGVPGKADGDSLNASFNAPSYIVIDPVGNLFVSDLQNFNIRKITPFRQVSTYAGRDISSPDPIFGYTYGMALDKSGSLYDVEYALVRKITSPSVSSVFAGSLTEYYKDSLGINAGFHVINQITIDKYDNIYLTDYDMTLHPQIRKVTQDGTVSTLILHDNTNFTDLALPDFYYLFAIVADSVGNLYKTSNGSNLIKKITPNGNVTQFAGMGNIGFTDGEGANAQFNGIGGMAVDGAGNLYVTDTGNGAVRKVSKDGKVTTIAGTGERGFADGEGNQAKFSYPFGITISKDGIIYVADQGNNKIRKIEYK
jgi:sugar lactone lactonase YvrE